MRSLPLVWAAVVGLAIGAFACGNQEPAQSPSAAQAPSEPASPEPAAAEAPAEPKKPRKPFDVTSACAEVVTLVFSEDPKAPGALKKTIAQSTTVEGPRDDDGNQTVWLLDTNGEPLLKVRVTRGMKRVEVGKSCRTLDAR